MLKIVYLVNIFVAGFIGFMSIFNAELASIVIYQRTFEPNQVMQLIGSFWIAIAAISFIGLIYPIKYSPILIFQSFYQLTWLVINALFFKNKVPIVLSAVFIAWTILILFYLPWKYIFKASYIK